MALELGACIFHCVPRKIFKHLIDLGHLGIAGRIVGVFLKCTPQIVIHRIKINGIRILENGANEVIKVFWLPLLTLSGGMAKSWILLPYIWPSSSNRLVMDWLQSQQHHIVIWIRPKMERQISACRHNQKDCCISFWWPCIQSRHYSSPCHILQLL